jgi:hypothetical protein
VSIFIVAVSSMIIHAMMYGPQAALIGESFPTHLRDGGAGLGYQLTSVFAGGRRDLRPRAPRLPRRPRSAEMPR